MHLAAQLIESNHSSSNASYPSPQGVTSIIVSKTGSIELSPIDRGVSALELTKYLKFWNFCMLEPKPLPVQTGFAYLKKPESAQKIYEGDSQSKGEVDRNPYLKRCWSDFSSLCRDGEFEILSREILGLLDKSTEKEQAIKR
jgi:exodeoxyribonuclease V gamma subunit